MANLSTKLSILKMCRAKWNGQIKHRDTGKRRRRRTATSVAARTRVYLFFFFLAGNTTFEHSNTAWEIMLRMHMCDDSVRSDNAGPLKIGNGSSPTDRSLPAKLSFLLRCVCLFFTRYKSPKLTPVRSKHSLNFVYSSALLQPSTSNLPTPTTRSAPMGMWHMENLWESSLQIRIRLMNYIKKCFFFFSYVEMAVLSFRNIGCKAINYK